MTTAPEVDRGPRTAPLVLSHHSVRHASLRERVEAASRAGFDGIGLNLASYRAWRDAGHDDSELHELLDAHGQRLLELEALAGWAGPAHRRERAAADEALAHHLADTFGPRYLQTIGPFDGTLDDAARAFAGLCDRAAAHGLTVGLEFLPFTNIADVATAAAIVQRAGRDNGGLCVDAWHFFRGTPDWHALESVPGELVADVQLNDGPLHPEHDDYLHDCLTNRRVPGDGEFDLVRFVRTLDTIGCRAPLSVEVISAALDELPPVQAATRMAEATRRTLARARHPS